MLNRLKPFLVGFAGAIAGAIVIGLIYTAYTDHERTTAMWNYINSAIAAQKAATPTGAK